jgi:hypothetical protein
LARIWKNRSDFRFTPAKFPANHVDVMVWNANYGLSIRFAIRVLAFGGDVESAALIAECLFHPHAAVARAARAGLLALGDGAITTLIQIRSEMRPDRRAAVDAVIDELRASR